MSRKHEIAPFVGIGASNHSDTEREKNDFYATDPLAITMLHHTGLLDPNRRLWECACGDGMMSKELERLGYTVVSSDLYDRGYGVTGIDFLGQSELERFDGDIITNPPYSFINDFIVKGLRLTGGRLYIFGRIQTLEGQERYKRIFRDNPPSWVLPFVKRVNCYKGGEKFVGNLLLFVMLGLYGILMTIQRSVRLNGCFNIPCRCGYSFGG